MHPMLTTAVKAARRAGNVINRGARDLDLLKVSSKGPKDFVSEIDHAAEAAIVETLLGAYPSHAILAEEGTAKGENANAEYVWIIDPLDGTTNFLHGFPQYCVSIALEHRGIVTQGVIYDPVRNDLFTATRGRGAFLNDRRIRVSKRQHLRECLSVLEPALDLALHPGEVELALWFHDAVYDPKGKDNEARSADWACQALAQAGADAAVQQRVRVLIMATCHDAEPTDPDARLLVDIDLAILGAEPARFAEYDAQVRAEYRWVPGWLYRRKRKQVLAGFLARPAIYGTERFRERLEGRARENLRCSG